MRWISGTNLKSFIFLVVSEILVLCIVGCKATTRDAGNPTYEILNIVPTSTNSPDTTVPIKLPENCWFSSMTTTQWVVTTCHHVSYPFTLYIKKIDSADHDWTLILPEETLQIYPGTSFSPDGQWLAIVDSYNERLLLIKTEEWQIDREISVPYIAGEPIWAPDSQTLALYANDQMGGTVMLLANLDGNLETLITWDDLFPGESKPDPTMSLPGFGPTWSPDGKKLAYIAYTQSIYLDYSQSIYWKGNQLWEIDITSGEKNLIVSGDLLGSYPVWSPDGEKIALLSPRFENSSSQIRSSLVVIYLDEKKPITVLELNEPAGSIRIDSLAYWSPDSTCIAYHEFSTDDNAGLYVINIVTGLVEKVANNQYNPQPIQWTADGESLFVGTNDFDNNIRMIDLIKIK